jgi:hypothetical protein
MSKISIIVSLVICFFPFLFFGQQKVNITVQLDYNHQPLEFGRSYFSKQKDSLRVTQFKCYLSNVKLHFKDGSTQAIDKKYILIALDSAATQKIDFYQSNPLLPDYLECSIGVDSIPNTQGALADDLDVQNGMYWAWQSGYINWKIEGTSASCATHKQQFAFHIGGYKANQNALRTIRLPFGATSYKLLHIELANFFDEISLQNTNTVQIPGVQAMQLADLFTKTLWLE